MKCKICSSNGIFLDDYRFNINYDKKYFGSDLKIYHCEKCDFGFCEPMPEVNKLDSFYSNIYRSPGRPHESQLDADPFRDQILNYIQYLSTFIDFNKIKNVFDFGAGVGDLGYALKKRFNHINLSTIESDSYVKNILRNRSYNVFENFSQIDASFDLIISTHCFEHLTDLEIIKDLKNISHQNTYLFIEIPNTNFGELFFKRPYDSPHLLFFTRKSIQRIANKFNMSEINISTASFSIEEDYRRMEREKAFFQNWEPNKKSFNLKKMIKNLIPNKIMKLISLYRLNNEERLSAFSLNDKNLTALRVIFKINNQ